jgi:hypothetical protein
MLTIPEAGLPILNLDDAKDKAESIGIQINLDDGDLLLRGPGLFDAYLTPWRPPEAILRAIRA